MLEWDKGCITIQNLKTLTSIYRDFEKRHCVNYNTSVKYLTLSSWMDLARVGSYLIDQLINFNDLNQIRHELRYKNPILYHIQSYFITCFLHKIVPIYWMQNLLEQ